LETVAPQGSVTRPVAVIVVPALMTSGADTVPPDAVNVAPLPTITEGPLMLPPDHVTPASKSAPFEVDSPAVSVSGLKVRSCPTTTGTLEEILDAPEAPDGMQAKSLDPGADPVDQLPASVQLPVFAPPVQVSVAVCAGHEVVEAMGPTGTALAEDEPAAFTAVTATAT
jgi:hypothetical protein